MILLVGLIILMFVPFGLSRERVINRLMEEKHHAKHDENGSWLRRTES